jgi:Tfp pilus assembly major pilin PilA
MQITNDKYIKYQQGMTFIGMIIVIGAIVSIATVGMKVMPAYLEYTAVKNAIKKAVADGEGKKGIVDSFNKIASVDDIKSVTGADLVASDNQASVDYQVVVPIVANASILLDFSASATK